MVRGFGVGGQLSYETIVERQGIEVDDVWLGIHSLNVLFLCNCGIDLSFHAFADPESTDQPRRCYRAIEPQARAIHGRVMRSGMTVWSKSAPESNPSLSVASRRLVPS